MDWRKLINELQAAGVTQAQIAEKAGLSSSSPVSDLARGETKRPSWDLGEAVRQLHNEHFGGKRKNRAAASDDRPARTLSDRRTDTPPEGTVNLDRINDTRRSGEERRRD